ncbi:hypothetical protein [Pseudorhodobacter aquimaris]|uniref:hypothetical protein n=1 Tax=Pseudorhodobacter aquimaris TaxID=687412 RepID=UPI0012EE7A65|nr:hypothetical protein [Pseudorhodobacter aquimaris]
MAEFHWLYDCFEASMAAHAPIEGIDYSCVPSRVQMLGRLGKGLSPSQLVSGVRSALGDAAKVMRILPKDNPAKGAALHANYAAIRGRSLEDDIALAKKAHS